MPAFAQQSNVGVHVGDAFKYSVSGFSELFSWNMTSSDGWSVDFIDVYVKEISDNYVTFWGQFSFKNGTKTNDALISREHLSEVYLFVIESDLTEEDFINLVNTHSDIYDIELTETVFRNYMGLERETYHVVWRIKSGNYAGYGIFAYWDKPTGILVQMSIFDNQGEEEEVEVLSYELMNTNLWIIPEFPSWTILPLCFTATLVALLLKKKIEYLRS